MPNPKSKISATDRGGSANPVGGQNQKSAPVEFASGSVEETQALGERLGRLLQAGDVVALYGELGSGKTTLMQGIAKGLGRQPQTIKSPTFVLMREYPPGPSSTVAEGTGGAIPLIHLDGYRLQGTSAAAWLDVELLFSPRKITVIEWAERFGNLLPPEHLAVHLEHVSANRRRIRASAHGARVATLLDGLRTGLTTAEHASGD